MKAQAQSTPCPSCGGPRRRGWRLCASCRPKPTDRKVDRLDYALLDELLRRGRACDCRCPADDHDRAGCRWCGMSRCRVPYTEHGDREAHEELVAVSSAGEMGAGT